VPSITEETEFGDPADGTPTLTKSVTYNSATLDVSAKSIVSRREWYDVDVEIVVVDYLKVIPLNGWPSDDEIYLNVRHTGEATATRSQAWTSGGLCYGDNAEISMSLLYSGLDAEPACGELEGSAEVDEVTRVRFSSGDDEWQMVDGSIEAWVRTRGNLGESKAHASLSATVEGAEDSQGNPIDVLVCSASGTQY
jgi:hypothetical protein